MAISEAKNMKVNSPGQVAMSERKSSLRERIMKPISRTKNSMGRMNLPGMDYVHRGHTRQTNTIWKAKAVVDRLVEETDGPKSPYRQYARTPKILRNKRGWILWKRSKPPITLPCTGETPTQAPSKHTHPDGPLDDQRTVWKPRIAAFENISDMVLPGPKFPQIWKRSSCDLEEELREAVGSSLAPSCWSLLELPSSSANDLLDMKGYMTDPSPQPEDLVKNSDLSSRSSVRTSRPSPVTGSYLHLRGRGGKGVGLLGHLFGLRMPKGDPEERKFMDEKIGFVDWYIVGGPARGMTWREFAELNRKRVEKTNEIERKKKQAREAAKKAKAEKK
ncbi:uncharacterized protein BP5553_01926 [Venustampulla echinocandica]|uniref:Uncharacterized protein n=1 Tax=Venustampulla echinocandica TaxID=2656787 RepID=A0A370U2E6_9HELO|nr:uncharacterized protein BP5553_01926 [Venustampulla echinocandica]RDL41947.1 hypothetical protein BP5553_01926 [Venustampulla echinocandica]